MGFDFRYIVILYGLHLVIKLSLVALQRPDHIGERWRKIRCSRRSLWLGLVAQLVNHQVVWPSLNQGQAPPPGSGVRGGHHGSLDRPGAGGRTGAARPGGDPMAGGGGGGGPGAAGRGSAGFSRFSAIRGMCSPGSFRDDLKLDRGRKKSVITGGVGGYDRQGETESTN